MDGVCGNDREGLGDGVDGDGKDDLVSELFPTSNTQSQIHNTDVKHMAQKYTPSLITQTILSTLTKSKSQPWQILSNIPNLLQQIFTKIHQTDPKQCTYQKPTNHQGQQQNKVYQCVGSVYFQKEDLVWIGKGTRIQHGAVIIGPCVIGEGCEIRKGAYLRGNVVLGNGVLIGNSCQAKNSIMMDYCQIAHFNYIGDSILGIRAHFSGGSITSNYKLDGTEIKANVGKEGVKPTGTNKLGAIVGNFSEIGCNSILNPGSIIGRSCVIYPMVNWRGYLKSNQIVKLTQQQQIVQRK